MHVLTSELARLALPDELAHRESVLTIGAFDGIHLGHQALIQRLVDRAKRQDQSSGLITFYPHPATILAPQHPTLYLTTPGEKMVLLEPFGLDWLAVLSFTPQLATTLPRVFVQHLYERVNMRSLWVGTDFALGRNREGDIVTLRYLGQEMGFDVHEIPYVASEGDKVSSTRIRTLLRQGCVAKAARLLGRYYNLCGEVVHGAQRGRRLGYPTANISVLPNRVVPVDGIYATLTCLGTECYSSVTSIGVRPSFDNGERSVEVYLLDFDGDLYGCDLSVAFVARLRPELRFADVQDLIDQIGRDVRKARQILDSITISESAHQFACFSLS
jgi:riboflavin kinase/FMN adenylyltransferase